MKIILNKEGNFCCYSQVKDIAYLSEYTGNKKYMKKYIDLVNQGFNANDFIKISNSKIIKDLISCDDIVDYMDYRKLDFFSLSRILSVNAYSNFGSKENVKKREEIQQLIRHGSGNETLKLPLVADGEVDIKSNSGYQFYSCIVPGYYVLKNNCGDIDDGMYMEFLDDCLDSVGADMLCSSKSNDKLIIKTSVKKKKFTLKKTPKKS